VFTVQADAVPLPTYQWRFNGVPLDGKVSPTLALVNVTPANAGSYDVVVANHVSAVTSQSATLAVRTDALSLTNYTLLASGQVQFQVHTISGRQYWLQYKDDLIGPIWSNLPPVAGTNGWLILSDTPGGVAQRFYRVREE
jgi:hypothetical protein